MERAVAFYEAAFGCKKTFGDEFWTSLTIHGLTLGLHGTEGKAVPTIPYDDHGAHAGGTLTFKSDNIKEDRARLEKLGAKIISEFDADWGQLLVFQDLDGNVLNLMKPNY
jgi:predicted enzyme related to lactoylglutathione lyase